MKIDLEKKVRRYVKRIYSYVIGQKQKHIISIPDQARFGNLLYFYLQSYIHQKENLYFLHTITMDYWLKYFPNFSQFVVYPKDFKKYDNIDWLPHYFQEFGKDFTKKDLNNFIREVVFTNDFFSHIKTEEKTVINIRRGDFYIGDKTTASSFDQIKYVKKVIALHPQIFNCKIEIVSDDINWCKENLKLPYENIIYKENSSPIEDFISICTAKNLVATNSTFSYWGGYICGYLQKGNLVIAPNFGATLFKNKLAHQVDPEWIIIDVLEE